jgi:mono/diheme cytochrome c family protein
VAVVAGCGSTPESGPAVCPPPPDASVLARVASRSVPPGDASTGAALFARECARCHSSDVSERGSRLFRGYPRLDCTDYLAQVPAPYLYEAISAGGPAVGRRDVMKPFSDRLSPQEIADLVAFLRSGT